jgi:biopolymer transport protein ExbD
MKLPRGEMKRARIEIIPMIDTIFFLLVFFMIASLSMVPMSAHKVDLPSSETASLKPQEKIVVTISKEGDYYVDRERVVESQIKPLVAARVSENPSVAVIINCDKDQRLDKFQRAFDLIKQANAGTVMIATAPESPAQP